MNPREQMHYRIAMKVVDWAGRVATQEASMCAVVQEMRTWVNRCPDRTWNLAATAVGCVKEMMQGVVEVGTGDLVLAGEGSWIIDAIQGPSSREPDVVCTVQAAIAMLNRDADMAYDLLVAHERVGGPPGLFGVARAATGMAASLMDPSTWTVTRLGGADGVL